MTTEALAELFTDLRATRTAIASYRDEVARFATCAKADRETLIALQRAMDGDPADDRAPGLKAKVQSLEQSRVYLRRAVQAAWAVLLVAIGALTPQLLAAISR